MLAVVGAVLAWRWYDDPDQRAERLRDDLADIAIAYVDFALQRTGLFRAMFAEPCGTEPERVEAVEAIKGYLTGLSQQTLQGAADSEDTATAVWALVHGLAFLHLDGKLDATTAAMADASSMTAKPTPTSAPTMAPKSTPRRPRRRADRRRRARAPAAGPRDGPPPRTVQSGQTRDEVRGQGAAGGTGDQRVPLASGALTPHPRTPERREPRRTTR